MLDEKERQYNSQLANYKVLYFYLSVPVAVKGTLNLVFLFVWKDWASLRVLRLLIQPNTSSLDRIEVPPQLKFLIQVWPFLSLFAPLEPP